MTAERRTVPVRDLVDDPALPPRLTRGVEALAAAIAKDGLLQELVVREGEDGEWCVVLGRRRRAALALLGVEEVEIRVIHADDEQVLALAARERGTREDTPALEQAWQVARRAAEAGSQAEVARELSVTPGLVSQLCSIAEAFPPERLEEAGVSTERAAAIPLRELRRLAAVGDSPERRRQLRVAAGVEEEEETEEEEEERPLPRRALEALNAHLEQALEDAREEQRFGVVRIDRLLTLVNDLHRRIDAERQRRIEAQDEVRRIALMPPWRRAFTVVNHGC